MLKWNDIITQFQLPHYSVKEPLEILVKEWKTFQLDIDPEVLDTQENEHLKREVLAAHLNLLFELEKITIEDFI